MMFSSHQSHCDHNAIRKRIAQVPFALRLRRKRVQHRKVESRGEGTARTQHKSSTLSISTRVGESCAKMKVVVSLWSTFHGVKNLASSKPV